MKKLSIVTLGVALLTLLATPGLSQDAQTPEAPINWSGFTNEQLAEHLGLSGGNVAFEFDQPVYVQIKVVSKKPGNDAAQTMLNLCADEPDTAYSLFIKVEDKDDPRENPNRVHKKVHVDYHKQGTNAHAGLLSEGAGMNWLLETQGARYSYQAAWNHSGRRLALDEQVTLYEIFDPDGRDDQFYRLTVRFTTTRPEPLDDDADATD